MKPLFSLFVPVFFSSFLFAQDVVVWEENFPSGIPSSWGNEEAGGVAGWQYRGPATSPDISVGSASLCLLAGETVSAPIQSATAENGFVIFDAAWWDNPDLPCNSQNIGSGPAPGPHHALLTSPSIDLTGVMYPAMEFHQYYRRSQGNTRVEYSINGGAWTLLFQNSVATGQATSRHDHQRLYFPAEVANQPDVRMRFVFEGLYYFWMLDDIRILNVSANDVMIVRATYGNFDFFSPEHPTGFEEMEYSRYPVEMPPYLKFNVTAQNNGYHEQTNVKLKAKVERITDGAILSETESEGDLAVLPGETQPLDAGYFQMPPEIGQYRVIYEITQAEPDNIPSNSSRTLYFDISEDIYSREKGPLASVILPVPGYETVPFEVGATYHVPVEGQQVYSLSCAFGPGTVAPAHVSARLYKVSFTTDLVLQLLTESPPVYIQAEHVNVFGGNTYLNIPFAAPYPLEEGEAYMAAVVSYLGMGETFFGLNGEADFNTAWVRIMPNTGPPQLYSLSRIPMIRMNLGLNFTGTEDPETTKENSALTLYPNPVSDILYIQTNDEIREIRWYDLTGKLVRMEQAKEISKVYQAEVGDLFPGMYIIKVRTKTGVVSERVIKSK